ncbi:hypothetical protein PM082_016311 [Marasmius tenuissimus]|nr:hypothetical protein PM082_016311 [Marasmius tenuissimus]
MRLELHFSLFLTYTLFLSNGLASAAPNSLPLAHSKKGLVHTTALKALKSRTGFGFERRRVVSASAVYKQHIDKAAGRLGRALEERVVDSGAYAYRQYDKRLNRSGIPLGLVKTASGTTKDSPSKDREAGHSGLGDLIAAVDPPCSDPVECGVHSAELENE